MTPSGFRTVGPVTSEERRRERAIAELERHSYCREDLGMSNCNAPAEFLLWGKMLSPEALGPRCYDHAAKHVGHRALGDPQWAVMDLRPLIAGLDVGRSA